MDGRPTWTDCDEAGDYVVPNVLSPRDLVSRTDTMEKPVPHTHAIIYHLPVTNSVVHFFNNRNQNVCWSCLTKLTDFYIS